MSVFERIVAVWVYCLTWIKKLKMKNLGDCLGPVSTTRGQNEVPLQGFFRIQPHHLSGSATSEIYIYDGDGCKPLDGPPRNLCGSATSSMMMATYMMYAI